MGQLLDSFPLHLFEKLCSFFFEREMNDALEHQVSASLNEKDTPSPPKTMQQVRGNLAHLNGVVIARSTAVTKYKICVSTVKNWGNQGKVRRNAVESDTAGCGNQDQLYRYNIVAVIEFNTKYCGERRVPLKFSSRKWKPINI